LEGSTDHETVLVVRQLPAAPEAAQIAREEIESLPALEAHKDLQFAAALLATELVTNSLRHAGLTPDEEITLVADCSPETLHTEVSDHGAGFNPLEHLRARPDKPPRHGYKLINVLADRWGFRRDRRLFCVWFELDLTPGRRPWRGREPIRLRPH
jgi:anti-sigma regulatory factor (Ser/Thr protein kinase)